MRTLVRLALAVMLALAVVTPVLAKEGMEARLDRAIPLNGDPGAPVSVGFTVTDTDSLMPGQSAFLRVHPVGGPPVETIATDDGDGHYTATFAMPVHGVASVEIGLVGESCESGTCTRSDLLFQVAGPEGGAVYVPTTIPPPANPGKVTTTAAPASPATSPAPAAPPTVPLLPLLVLGTLLVAGGGALVLSARRGTHPA